MEFHRRGSITLRTWILLVSVLALGMSWGCGGEKFKDSGGTAEDEILFVNDTENDYRITVVEIATDFTLRGGTRKGVKVQVDEDQLYRVNIERTKGEEGLARYSELARGGNTVRLFIKFNPVNETEAVALEVTI